MKNSIQTIGAGVQTTAGKATAALGTVFVAVMTLGFSSGIAGATLSADPTGGAAASLQTLVTQWITDYGLPALVVVFGLGLIVAVLLKLGKRSVKSL